jgi:hypothetical protein
MADEAITQSEKGAQAGTVNPPALTKTLQKKVGAIKDVAQARAIITTLEIAARERNLKNARIMAKYNAEKPYTQQALEAEGLAWKSNFTTMPLPMLIDKVAPRFVKALDGVKYLTNSALPETFPDADVKTEAFRREITKVIRSRPGWTDFISEVSQENALFGFTAVAWLDEFTWFPKHYRQDSFFVPTGTKQQAGSAQVVAFRETFLVHELFQLVEDREAAEVSGWDIENVVRAINSALPENRRTKETNWERIHEDLQRESNVGLSHESGALVVTVWHLLATEISGKVSHYILVANPTKPMDWRTGKAKEKGLEDSPDVLFEREERFENMAIAASFFAFQHGNGKLHGSKGIGREVYAMAAMVDRARNEVVDRLNLAGKVIVQGDPKQIKKFKMHVVGNVLLMETGFTISSERIDAAVEPFMALDQFMTGILDQKVGATTPKAFEGERVTKAAVDLFAAREEESRDNIIGRFLSQFATMMTTMQKRLCDPQTSEADAKAMQERLLKVMSREELDEIAKQPVAETVKDFTEIERQQVVLIASEAKGNPLYNQKEIERRKLSALVGEDFANAVLLPDEDPTIVAEQTRMQQLEMLIILGQASAVAVSPRDNHIVHLEVLSPAMEKAAAEAVTKGAEGLEILQALLVHAEQHFSYAEQTGMDKNQLAPIKQNLSKLRSAVDKLNQMEQDIAAGRPVPGVTPPEEVAPVV